MRCDHGGMNALAQNLTSHRKRRGLSLIGLSERSGIAKSTLSQLESAQGNPTVETLWAIANALDVSFGDLVATQANVLGHAPSETVFESGTSVRLIEQSDSEPKIETYLLTLDAGAHKHSAAHRAGVSETVTVIAGRTLVGPETAPQIVNAGETHAFRADVDHIYAAVDAAAKAIVCVKYPRLDDDDGDAVRKLDWPQDSAAWDGVRAVIQRSLIDVVNGADGQLIRFRGAPNDDSSTPVSTLREAVFALDDSRFMWPLARLAGADEQGPFLAIFPQRNSNAFDAPYDISPWKKTTMTAAIWLAHLAQAPGRHLGETEKSALQDHVGNPSLVLRTLAADALTQRGEPTTPIQPGDISTSDSNDVESCRGHDAEGTFSDRIDAGNDNILELLRPAYARQIVALAQDIAASGDQSDNAVDIGTGPGLPLLMLTELRQGISWTAIEPDETAFGHLKENVREHPEIEPHQADFLEYNRPAETVGLLTSVGASHHFNTAYMFQQAMMMLKPGGILAVADEFLPLFTSRDTRNAALVQHHGAYMVNAMASLEAARAGLDSVKDRDTERYRAFKASIPAAMVAARRGDVGRAIQLCRNLYTRMTGESFHDPPHHEAGAYARFFWLELQAMVAGFDYEVERKTYPQRFAELAAMAGFEQTAHRRIFPTTDADPMGGGTHVFTFRKPLVER